LLAEVLLENRLLKKVYSAMGSPIHEYPAAEKLEIIRLFEQSSLSVRRTLVQLGIPRSTFYRWYEAYLARGAGALQVSRRYILQDLLLQRELGHQPVELGVLLLQRFEPPRLVQLPTAILLAPAIKVWSLMPASRHACGVSLPLAIITSTCRSSIMICSGLYPLVGIPALLPVILSHSRWYKNPRSRHLRGLAFEKRPSIARQF
jgi:transposase-like protein